MTGSVLINFGFFENNTIKNFSTGLKLGLGSQVEIANIYESQSGRIETFSKFKN